MLDIIGLFVLPLTCISVCGATMASFPARILSCAFLLLLMTWLVASFYLPSTSQGRYSLPFFSITPVIISPVLVWLINERRERLWISDMLIAQAALCYLFFELATQKYIQIEFSNAPNISLIQHRSILSGAAFEIVHIFNWTAGIVIGLKLQHQPFHYLIAGILLSVEALVVSSLWFQFGSENQIILSLILLIPYISFFFFNVANSCFSQRSNRNEKTLATK